MKYKTEEIPTDGGGFSLEGEGPCIELKRVQTLKRWLYGKRSLQIVIEELKTPTYRKIVNYLRHIGELSFFNAHLSKDMLKYLWTCH